MQFKSNRLILALASATAALSMAAPAHAIAANDTPGNLVTNGSMNYTTSSTFSTSPIGWTNLNSTGINDGNISGNFGASGLIVAGTDTDGGTIFGAATNPLAAPVGAQGISQTVSGLVSGQKYTVSFQAAASANFVIAATYQWGVTFAGVTQYGAALSPSTVNCPITGCAGGAASVTYTNNPWVTQSLTFTATGPSSLLTFTALYPSSTNSIDPELLLDGVVVKSVVSAVPEPATATMAVAGLLAVGFLARRRRQRQA